MYDNDDVLLPLAQIVIKYNYPFERFHYETEDGYILTTFRISGPKGSRPEAIYEEGNKGRPAVIFQHGMLDSSDAFLCQAEKSFAF